MLKIVQDDAFEVGRPAMNVRGSFSIFGDQSWRFKMSLYFMKGIVDNTLITKQNTNCNATLFKLEILVFPIIAHNGYDQLRRHLE